jgi:hypothetical protein
VPAEVFAAIADLWIAAMLDLGRMCRRMWPVLLQIGALYVVAVMAWFTVPHLLHPWLGIYVGRYLVLVGCAFATSSYLVALHRFIATGEVRWLPARGAYDEAVIYASWSAFVLLIEMGPIILSFVVEAITRNEGLADLTVILELPWAWVLVTQLTTLLPMAALDSRNATWEAARQQSRKRFWFIWAATNAATLPAYLVLAILLKFGAPFASSAVFSVLMIACLLATQLLPLSVSTRLFRQYRAETAAPTWHPKAQGPRRS